MKEKPIDIYKCELEVLSPVHIGTGYEFTPFDYFVRNGEVVIYNINRLLSEDSEFAQGLLKKSEQFKYQDYYLSNILSKENMDNSHYYFFTIDVNEKGKSELRRLRDRENRANIRSCIRNGENSAYIPGSSVKGAIRTAYAYCVMKKDSYIRELFLKEMQKEIKDIKNGKDIINMFIFQKDKGLQAKGDVFRILNVSDTKGTRNKTRMEITKTLSSKELRGYVNLYETIPVDNTDSFIIGLHSLLEERFSEKLRWKDLLNKYPLTIETIPVYCQEFYGDLILFEKEYFKEHSIQETARPVFDFYESLEDEHCSSNQSFMRIGQGGGFFNKTLAMLFTKTAGFDYAEYIKKFGRNEQSYSPSRSSRVVLESNTKTPVLGWVKVSFNVSEKINSEEGEITDEMIEKLKDKWGTE